MGQRLVSETTQHGCGFVRLAFGGGGPVAASGDGVGLAASGDTAHRVESDGHDSGRPPYTRSRCVAAAASSSGRWQQRSSHLQLIPFDGVVDGERISLPIHGISHNLEEIEVR